MADRQYPWLKPDTASAKTKPDIDPVALEQVRQAMTAVCASTNVETLWELVEKFGCKNASEIVASGQADGFVVECLDCTRPPRKGL